MTITDLIDQFISDLEFDVLIAWADMLKVPHDEDMWFDDEWPDREDELRVKVAGALGQVGEKQNPYRHYNKARSVQLSINRFNSQNEDGHYD